MRLPQNTRHTCSSLDAVLCMIVPTMFHMFQIVWLNVVLRLLARVLNKSARSMVGPTNNLPPG